MYFSFVFIKCKDKISGTMTKNPAPYPASYSFWANFSNLTRLDLRQLYVCDDAPWKIKDGALMFLIYIYIYTYIYIYIYILKYIYT